LHNKEFEKLQVAMKDQQEQMKLLNIMVLFQKSIKKVPTFNNIIKQIQLK